MNLDRMEEDRSFKIHLTKRTILSEAKKKKFNGHLI